MSVNPFFKGTSMKWIAPPRSLPPSSKNRKVRSSVGMKLLEPPTFAVVVLKRPASNQAQEAQMTAQMLRKLMTIAFFTVIVTSSASLAQADTITFNSLEQAGNALVNSGDPYVENGFRILNGGELYYSQQSHYSYAGSAGLHERISNGLLTLNRVDGAAFTLVSIQLSTLVSNGTSPAVTFTGHLVGGGTVTQTFTPTVFGFQTFNFNSSFTNLLSVTWHQGTDERNAHQFDNIVVDPVPEPSAMILLGSGLVAAATRIRKWRRSAGKASEGGDTP